MKKWVCTRCGTINKSALCSKCRGTARRFGTPYKKPKKEKPAPVTVTGVTENKAEKRYRLISEVILVLHYLFLLIPVIGIKGVNTTQTYSAFGMLYDLSLCVYIFALFALTCTTVYLMEILPKIPKWLVYLALGNNLLNFSITPVLMVFGKFTGFSLTFGGVVYILLTLGGFAALVFYYREVFDGAEDCDEDYPEADGEIDEDDVKTFVLPEKPREYRQTDFYRPKVDIKINNDFVTCPVCGKKVQRGVSYCPYCNTLLHRTAPSRNKKY